MFNKQLNVTFAVYVRITSKKYVVVLTFVSVDDFIWWSAFNSQ